MPAQANFGVQMLKQRAELIKRQQKLQQKEDKHMQSVIGAFLRMCEVNYFHILFIRLAQVRDAGGLSRESVEEFADTLWYLLQRAGHIAHMKPVRRWIQDGTVNTFDALPGKAKSQLLAWRACIEERDASPGGGGGKGGSGFDPESKTE